MGKFDDMLKDVKSESLDTEEVSVEKLTRVLIVKQTPKDDLPDLLYVTTSDSDKYEAYYRRSSLPSEVNRIVSECFGSFSFQFLKDAVDKLKKKLDEIDAK